MSRRNLLSISIIILGASLLFSQSRSKPLLDAVWAALSAPAINSVKSAHIEDLEIVRDRIRIILTRGTLQLLQPVNGIVFGAVFHGSGRLQAEPPNAMEEQQLQLFTGQDKLDMIFTDATFSFSGGLLDEVFKKVEWQAISDGNDNLYVSRQREREQQGAESLPRLLKSIMSGDAKRTAYFLADLKTKEKGWVEVREDAMLPEQLCIGQWSDAGSPKIQDVWMNFTAGVQDSRHAYDDPGRLQDFLISGYKIDTSIAENGEIKVAAQITVLPRYSGENILLFSLDSRLRLNAIEDSQGRNLGFLQSREGMDKPLRLASRMFPRTSSDGQNKSPDASDESEGNYVAVELAEATDSGKPEQFTFHYGGKRVVEKVGNGNYFCPGFGWYPMIFEDLGVDPFAFRYNFDLTFRNSDKYILVATGNKVSERNEGKELITNWKSDIPLAVVGFAFGDYKITHEKAGDIEIAVYTNKQPDANLKSIQRAVENPLSQLPDSTTGSLTPTQQRSLETLMRRGAVGNLTPAAMAKTIAMETANTLRTFQNYFGPYPYKQLAVTNIPFSYGQGWPGLLYLGWFTFLDSTQRHVIGIKDQVGVSDYFRAHESSHQWWGHRVAWKSYHDQWLSEGFAEFSGKLYVQLRQNFKEFLLQLRKDKELLQSRDSKGHRIESLGPIWMGRRIISSKTDSTSYQNLIYSKGGYVLQMLRSQLNEPRAEDPDRLFKAMMHDYCNTYENKPASTEDFKSIVEKYMTTGMDLEHNHKMDWFFNQYVYGTGMPRYSFRASVEPTADGKSHVKGTIKRIGVPDTWKDVVPVYVHAGGITARFGTIPVTRATEEIDVFLPLKIDRVTIGDNEDLLAEVIQ